MKVKIGNEWHDSNDGPICVQLSETEQRQIASMDRSVATHGRYAVFPDGWTREQAREWISDGDAA